MLTTYILQCILIRLKNNTIILITLTYEFKNNNNNKDKQKCNKYK